MAILHDTNVEAIHLIDLETVRSAPGYATLANWTLIAGPPERALELESLFLPEKLDIQPVKRESDAVLAPTHPELVDEEER